MPAITIVTMIFLTRGQVDNIAEWSGKTTDEGTLTTISNPIYATIAQYIPKHVSPNVISFTGMLFGAHAWYYSTTSTHNMLSGEINCILVAISIIIYMTLDGVSKIHAKNIMNENPLVELFGHFCDCITNVFLAVTLCNVLAADVILNINPNTMRWIIIVMIQVCSLEKHVRAFTTDGTIIHNKYNAPTELLVSMTLLTLSKDNISREFTIVFISMLAIHVIVLTCTCMYDIIKRYKRNKDYATLYGVIFCLLIQVIKFLTVSHVSYMENGLILSTLCADIILSKIARRELHQLIPVMHLVTCLSSQVSIVLAVMYFVTNIYNVSDHLCIPVVNPLVNVFVCGYYDGFHVAHQLSLIKSSRLGTRLIVGMHSQDELIKKTRAKDQEPNIKIALLRFQAVAEFKHVNTVISNCQLVITDEFIKEHKIHVVCMSDEYVLKYDDNGNIEEVGHWYKIPFERGILKIVPRTHGISSTELRAISENKKHDFEQLENLIKMASEVIKVKHV